MFEDFNFDKFDRMMELRSAKRPWSNHRLFVRALRLLARRISQERFVSLSAVEDWFSLLYRQQIVTPAIENALRKSAEGAGESVDAIREQPVTRAVFAVVLHELIAQAGKCHDWLDSEDFDIELCSNVPLERAEMLGLVQTVPVSTAMWIAGDLLDAYRETFSKLAHM